MRLYKVSVEEENPNKGLEADLELPKSQKDTEERAGDIPELLIESFVDTLISVLWSGNFPVEQSELVHYIEMDPVGSMEKIRTFLQQLRALPYGSYIKTKEDVLRYIESFSPRPQDFGEDQAKAFLKYLGIQSSRPEEVSLDTPIGMQSAKSEGTGLPLSEIVADKNTPLSELLEKEDLVDNLSKVGEIYAAVDSLDELPVEEADKKRGNLLLKLKDVERKISSMEVPEKVEKKIEELSHKLDDRGVFQRAVESLKDKYGLFDIKDSKILAYAAQLDRMQPIRPGEFKEGAPIGDMSIIPDIAKTGASDIAKFLLISRLSESKVFLTRNQKSGSPIGGGVTTKWPTTISGTDTFMDNRFSSTEAFISYSGNVSSLDNQEFKTILDKYLGKANSKIDSGRQGMYIWPMVFSRDLGVFTGMPAEAMLGLGEELFAAVEAEDKGQIRDIVDKYKYNSYGVLTDTSYESLSKNNHTFSSIATPIQMIEALAEAKGINPIEVYNEVKKFIAERGGSLKEDAGELVLDNKEQVIPFPPEALVSIAFYIVRLFISTCRANAISTVEEYISNEKAQKDVSSVVNGLIDDLDLALSSAGDFRLTGVTRAFTRPILQTTQLKNFGVSVDKLKVLAMEGISLSLRSGALLSLERAPFEFVKQASFNREAIYNIATTLSGAILDNVKTPKGEVKINMTNVISGARLTDFSPKKILDIEKIKQHGKYLLAQPEQTQSSVSETVRRAMVRMTSLVDNCNRVWIVGVEQDKELDTTVLSIRSHSSPVLQNNGNGATITIYSVINGERREVLSAQASKIIIRPAVGDRSGKFSYRLFITPSINFEYGDSDYQLDIGQEIMYQARLATEKNTLDTWIREVNKELFRFNNIKVDMIQAIAANNLSKAMEVMKNGEQTLRIDLNRFRTLNSDFKSIVDSVMFKSKDKEELDVYSRFIKDYVFKCVAAISQVRSQILEFKKAAAAILGVNI